MALLALGAGSAEASKGVVGVFGQAGGGDGEFQTAGGVAVNDASGDVYVADVDGQRVERFAADGSFLAAFGSPGSGAGQFAFASFSEPFFVFSPPQVAVDQSDGSVYVADTGNGRVEKFDATGGFLSEFGVAGSGDGELSFPQGVAVDPLSGDVLVADSGNGRIQRFTSAGAYVSQFASTGSAFGELLNPTRVAVDAAGDVYVVDSGNARVERYDAGGQFEAVVGSGSTVGAPTDIAVDGPNGRVLVADQSAGGVLELDLAGNVVDTHGVGAGFSASGLALRPSTGRVYVADGFSSRVFVLDQLTPATVTIEPVDNVGATVATFHGQVNPQGTATSYHFEYSTDGATWTPVPGRVNDPSCGCTIVDGVDVGAGSSAVAVSQDSTAATRDGQPIALVPNTGYHVRLVASKPFGGGDVVSDEVTFTTSALPPDVQARGAAPSETRARLAGRVNPHNSPTRYHFEVGTDTSYGIDLPVGQDGDAGAGATWVEVSQQVTGLQLGTVYHYRIVATNQAGTVTSQDRTFKTVQPPPPPPGRGYEKVSPDAKNGFSITGDRGGDISLDGNRVFVRLVGAGPGASSGQETPLLIDRDPSNGWKAEAVDPPTPVNGTSSAYEGLTGDLRRAVLSASAPLAGGAVSGERNLFLRDDPPVGGSFQRITAAATPFASFLYAGAADDLSTVVFESTVPQTGDAVTPGESYPYLWRDGQLRLVGVLPDGTIAPAGAVVGSGATAGRGTALGAVARDGTRVVFHVPEPGEASNGSVAGQLYLREDNGVDPASTVHVSGSQRSVADPAGPLPATFWAAGSQHASKVLFTSCEKLTDDSTASSDGDFCTAGIPPGGQAGGHMRGRDLYLFDLASGGLEDLSAGDGSGANVFGVIGASDDLGRVYFVAGGVLAPGGAVRGEPNLYLWDGGQVRFVATLNGDPASGKYFDRDEDYRGLFDVSNWILDPNNFSLSNGRAGSSRVAADGSSVAFVSRAPLTGFDNRNPVACPTLYDTAGGSPIGNLEGRCLEVFRFDAASGDLSCVSCGADGDVPSGDAGLSALEGRPGTKLRGNLTTGGDVFFESPDALVDRDTNGRIDVYEWHAGSVGLISTGKGTEDARFVNATPSGSDVVFATRSRLTGSDGDDAVDLYDARVGGGFPEPEPVVPCAGDECRHPAAGRPNLADPGTDQDGGAGPVGGSGPPVSLRVGRLSAAQRAALAAGRRIRLGVHVSRASSLSVTGRAKIGRRTRIVASGSARAAKGGLVRVGLRLSAAARRQLASGAKLRIRLTVRASGATRARTTTITLARRAR